MSDPLADVVTLLEPRTPYSKLVTGAGRWRVTRSVAGRPFYAVVLDGACRLTIEGRAPLVIEAGDFVLIPAAFEFTVSSLEPPPVGVASGHLIRPDGEIRQGDPDAPPDVRMLVGDCVFEAPDAGVLVSLLPQCIHVRGERRLSTLVALVRDECRARRVARDVILARLLEVLLIEALRASASAPASAGLLRGLADERLSVALRALHARPAHGWTVAALAKAAALSRSAFFERFSRTVGVAPMTYLRTWRLALAADLLRREDITVAEVAERVGYGSASAFSVAFTRHNGLPPAHYARAKPEPEPPRAALPITRPAEP
ncbi:MAG: AraC family transcriptional regulator [bacterium]